MLRVAIKGLLSRKLRLALTSMAIVLGVGFVAGAFFLTDSMRSSFDSLFDESVQGIDVQVQTVEYKDLAKQRATKGISAVPIDIAKVGVPPETITKISDVPGVKLAAGSVFEFGAQPLDKDGKPVSTGGAPPFAANWVAEAADQNPIKISRGKAPERGQVMLDETTMEKAGYEIGDTARILVQGGRKVEEFEISGVVKFGTSNSLLGASITVFETEQVQELLDMGDRFTAADVAGDGSVSPAVLKGRIQQAVGDEYDVITAEEFSAEQSEAIDSAFLDILQNVILGFAAVAVFVGAFTIFNTFTILVGQRTREFGLLRAIGGGQAQILGIVVLEALVIGIIASTLGILAGYGIATLLRGLINSFADGSIPEAPFPLETRTVVVSYAVGVIITLVASLLPAWRASRLSPLEALRSNSALAGRGWKAPVAGAVLCLAGAALIVSGFQGEGGVKAVLTSIGGGFALAIIGIALLSRLFILPVTRALGVVLGRGTTGELAVRNVLRNRARSATTASALMIGLALASLVLVFQSSLTATINRQIDAALGADISIYPTTLTTSGTGVVDQKTVDRIAKVDGIDQLIGQRIGGASIGKTFDPAKSLEQVAAFDDGAFDEPDALIVLTVREGTATPSADEVVIDEELAKDKGWKLGDEVPLAFSGDRQRTLEVAGIFKPAQLVGGQIIIAPSTFDAVQPPQQRAPSFVYASVDAKVDPSDVVTDIEKQLGDDAKFLEIKDSEALRKTFSDQLAPILGLVLGMLSLSLIIALFGIGNTLALNVFERTREIGLLRAVGGTQRQVRRMIRTEAVLVAVFGSIVGVIVGVGAGAAVIRALKSDGFVFAPNYVGIVGVLFAGFIAGLLASILPARRAARTDVLDAIATE